MAEYQQVEYQIGPDGRITERVIGATGHHCTTTTQGLETALGEVESRELLPEYEAAAEDLLTPDVMMQQTSQF